MVALAGLGTPTLVNRDLIAHTQPHVLSTIHAVEFLRVVADNALYNRQVKRDELFEDFLENGP